MNARPPLPGFDDAIAPAPTDGVRDSIGWMGTGRMGSAMARRLLQGGRSVSVYNRTRERAEQLIADGAKVVDTPAELAGNDVVFVSVGDASALAAVLNGPDGLLTGDGTPAVLVDCSTVSAEESAFHRRLLAERGIPLLVAPVSGNPRVARAGRLTLVVSGPRDAYERVASHLALLGHSAVYVGDGEVARLVKLCHNLFLGVVTQALAEVTVLAEQGGVARATFLDYLNKSVMGSVFTGYKAPQLVHLDFEATFTSRLLRKDFDLGLAAARSLEVPMPVVGLVYQLVQRLVTEGYAEKDFAALLTLEAAAAGLELVAEDVEVLDGLE
ncbi:MAG: NAD(P)-dependent oxidoreductase [Actinomycetota bacterium]|nr:NAD(P)-dependent oxidoreductase [Actinomycetota bacterium]